MHSVPKISVIVPVYKIEKYLNECVDSILSQTFSDFELILVDDGSPDKCPRICDWYAEKDKRVRVFHKPNGGLVSAWKKGVENANGEYVCFIDGDDFVDVKYFETFINALKNDTDMVCMSCIRYWNGSKQHCEVINNLSAGEYAVDNEILNRFLNDRGTYTKIIANSRWAKMIRSDLVKKYAAYCSEEVVYGEDYQLTAGIIFGSRKIVVLNEHMYYYRQNDNSIVHTYKQDMFNCSKKLFNAIRSIPNISSVENFDVQFNTEFLFYVINCIKNEYFYGKLNKKNFKTIANDEDTQAALKNYQSANMGKLGKWMINALKSNSLHKAKRSLFIFSAYCKLRGLSYR